MRLPENSTERSPWNWLANVVLYFIVVPLSCILIAGMFEHSLGADLEYWPLAYIFTTPFWPAVVVIVPSLVAIDSKFQTASNLRHRVVLAGAGGALLGTVAVFFVSGVTWRLGMTGAGALYGVLFRSTRPRAPKNNDGEVADLSVNRVR